MATAEKETVRVIVRCRPFSEKEKIAGHSNIISIDSAKGTVAIADPKSPAGGAPNDVPKSFTFDHAFDWNCKQTDVYNLTARPIVESVLNGYNGTIFAYGQTGTGKTFSMEGIRTVPELRGILPNSFEHIFAHIGTADSSARYLVRASYLEIYNEEIRDLLVKERKKLDIKERADTGVYVKDLSSFVVKDVEEMDKLMTAGNKNRSVGFTEMNAQSSRSHSIFTITVEASEKDTSGSGEERIRMGKLHLVDLAGSERQAKTQASGDRLKEAAKINLSLSALGNVISALVDGKSAHIPYRDSKLTRLLQDSLGGNARTLMIATLSPASYNYDETVGTLRYANRTKNIKNKPKINEDPKDAMLREYQEEIKRLKAQLDGAEGTGVQEDEEEEEEEEESENEEEIEDEQAKAKKISSPSKSTTPAATPKAPQKVKKVKKEKIPKAKAAVHAPPVSDEQLKEMEASVEREKTTIFTSKDMLEEERKAILIQLDLRSKEIALEREERTALAAKLEQMQAKLLVGGVNVLDQHTQQEQELAKAQAELEETRRKELELQRELEEREEQQLQIEESYSSLQEEAAVKTRKLKRLWNMLMEQKVEIKDLQTEHQREREDLLETVRELTRELRLKMLVISAFIPKEEQSVVEMSAEYDEAADKVRIAHIAHAGNNIRGKQQQGFGGNSTSPGGMLGAEESSDMCWDPALAFPDVYLSYETTAGVSPTSIGVALGPSSGRKKQSTRQAGARPDAAAPREQRRSRPPSSVSRATKETSIKAGQEEAQSNTPKVRGLVSKGKHYA